MSSSLTMLLLFCVICFAASSNSNDISAITFLKCYEFECRGQVKISSTKSAVTSGGYTVCLRVKFETWDKITLLQTSDFGVQLDEYREGTGTVFYGNHFQSFIWRDIIPLTRNLWNSFCVRFHPSFLTMALTINGLQVVNATDKKQMSPNKNDFSDIILGSVYFTGQISDLNIWSRVLSNEELEQYSNGCNYEFVGNSKPDIISWSKANVSFQDNFTLTTKIPVEAFCQEKPETELILITQYDSKHCRKFNGEMFYPRNSSHLQLLLKGVDGSTLTKTCSDRIRVPFERSQKNKTKWIYDRKNNLEEEEEEVSFQPWIKSNVVDDRDNKDCMYFDTVLKQYSEVSCSESYPRQCMVCELNFKRLFFNLKLECIDNHIDINYFLVKEKSLLLFSGVSGLTNIEWNGHFKVVLAREKIESLREVAGFTGTSPPFGNQFVDSVDVCDRQGKMEMKLNNVS